MDAEVIGQILIDTAKKYGTDSVVVITGLDIYDKIGLEVSGEIFAFSTKKREKKLLGKITEPKELFELNEDEVWEIGCRIHDNRHNLQVVENYLELDIEESVWEIEPEEIKSSDGTVIGMLGVRIDEVVENKKQLSVVYLSADGSYSTLTMFVKDEVEGTKQAFLDLRSIVQGIEKLIFKILPSDEKN